MAESEKLIENEAEAIECLKSNKPTSGYLMLQEAIDMAIQALEKQIPKKPIFDYNFSDTLSKFHCGCGNTIKVRHDVGIMDNNDAPNYCSKCGCRLDWSDEE